MVRNANVEARRQTKASKEKNKLRNPDTSKSKKSFNSQNYALDERGRSSSKKPRSKEQFYKEMMDHRNHVDKKIKYLAEDKHQEETAQMKRPEMNTVSRAIVNYSKYMGGVLSARKRSTNKSNVASSRNSSKIEFKQEDQPNNLVNINITK